MSDKPRDIGFRRSDEKGEITRAKGFEIACRLMKEYLNDSSYPMYVGDSRDDFYIRKFREIRDTYFVD